MKRTVLAALCCLFMLGACSRNQPAAIGQDANYRLEVTNTLTHPMTVTLDLGAGQHSVLGEVAAGQTMTFEIKDPSTNDITLRAANQASGHTMSERVELSRSKVARVTLK